MPVTICLIVINLVVFAVYIFLSSFSGLLNFNGPVLFRMGAGFGPNILLLHEYWRLPASLFLHANLEHIGLNMFSLFIFGRMLEKPMGSGRFLVLYVFSGLIGGLASMGVHPLDESVGASGAIFGLVGFYLNLQLQLDKKSHPSTTYRIRQLIGLALALYCLSLTPGVDNAAHFGGLMAGIIGGVAFQKISDFRAPWSWRDLAVTVAMAAVFAGGLYGEQRIFSNRQEMPVALLLRESVVCLQKHDLNGALNKLSKAIALEPKNQKARLVRSTISLTLGKYEEALTDINAALAVEPNDAMACNQRACIYLAMGQYTKALADARRAVEGNKHSAAALDTEAMALAYLGQSDQGLALLNRAIDEDNGASGIFFYHRASVYAALGDKAKADSDYKQADKLSYELDHWEHDRPLPRAVQAH